MIKNELRKAISKHPNIFKKDKPYHLKIRSANPSLNNIEDLFLTEKEFERLKKLLLINSAWVDYLLWVYTVENPIEILEINGVSLINRNLEYLLELLPGTRVGAVLVDFVIKTNWKLPDEFKQNKTCG